jgi:hypothetical protein
MLTPTFKIHIKKLFCPEYSKAICKTVLSNIRKEDHYSLGFSAVQFQHIPTFRRNISPASPGSKNKPSRKPADAPLPISLFPSQLVSGLGRLIPGQARFSQLAPNQFLGSFIP